MATIIGVKEEKASENETMNNLRSVLKMRIITTGAFMVVLAFMQNCEDKVFTAQEHG